MSKIISVKEDIIQIGTDDGKIGAGICYLLFCWTGIPVFIAFIEFIVVLFAKSDSYGNILV